MQTQRLGNIPLAIGGYLLGLRRLRRIRHIDPLDFSLVAEAGCLLAEVQQAAEAQQRLFPGAALMAQVLEGRGLLQHPLRGAAAQKNQPFASMLGRL